MRRDVFLKLTGLSAENHKNMVRRSVLPWFETEADDERPKRWADYTLGQVVDTVLALEIAKAGVEQGTASAMVVKASAGLKHWVGLAAPSSDPEIAKAVAAWPDIWLAAINFSYEAESYVVVRWTAAAGPLSKIMEAPTEFKHDDGRKISVADLEKGSGHIVLANFSRALRTIEGRAKHHGIEINFDEFAGRSPSDSEGEG